MQSLTTSLQNSRTLMLSTDERVRMLQRKLYLKAKQSKTFKFYVLYDKISIGYFIQEAYRRVKANGGAPGVDQVTFDKIEEAGLASFLSTIQDELVNNTYKAEAVRRVYIPKANGKLRPLGIPTIKDRVVQMSAKMVIEPIFEADFTDSSFGFRPKKSAKDAMAKIKEHLKEGRTAVYDVDLEAYFDTIPHDKLMKAVGQRIADRNVLALINKWLKCPIMDDETKKTYGGQNNQMGTPQGGVGPILSNLVLNKLDKYIEETLVPSFSKGTRRKANPAYSKITREAWQAKSEGDYLKAKTLNKQAQQMPSRLPNDPNFKRLWYVRYADDWLAGVIGTKEDAVAIKDQIAEYLEEELKLQLSAEKTLITHARTEKAKFLGYEVHSLHCDTKHTDGQRSINGSIGLRVPNRVIKENMHKYMKGGKAIHRPERMKDEPYSIVNQYQSEYRGVVQYYKMAYNLHCMSHLKYTMETSLVKTLAGKYKTTCSKIYRKYGTTITIPEGSYKVLQVLVPRENKRPLETHFGAVPLRWNKWVKIDDNKEIRLWSKRSEVVDRLLADQCELCGREGKIEMHHVRKLADVQVKHGKEIPKWKREMSMRRRKSLAVCTDCYYKIHSGEYDGKAIRKSAGEPRDIERVRHVTHIKNISRRRKTFKAYDV